MYFSMVRGVWSSNPNKSKNFDFQDKEVDMQNFLTWNNGAAQSYHVYLAQPYKSVLSEYLFVVMR